MHHATRSATRLATLALLAACGGDGPTPPETSGSVARLALADPLPVSASVGETFAPSVRAFGPDNRPVAGATLRFASARGTTTLAAATATTGPDGIATPGEWRLPTRPTVDTLVVTVEGASGVAALRIPMAVNAGPVVRSQLLAPAAGTGVLLQSMYAGPVFQLFDRYDNPAAAVTLTLEQTPLFGGRLPETLTADEQGIVRLADWTPRVIGTHTLRFLLPAGSGAITLPTLTRTVAQPACAPLQALPSPPWNGPSLGGTGTGVLTATRADGCSGRPDRWAFGVDSLREIAVDARVGTTPTALPVSIVRAGTTGPEGIVVPEVLVQPNCIGIGASCGILAILAPGEYELRVGTATTAEGTYRLGYENLAASPFGGTSESWVGRGATVLAGGGRSLDLPGSPVPQAHGVTHLVSMRDPARRSLFVRIDILGDVNPVIVVYGRTSPTATPVYLATGTTTVPQRNVQLEVPVEYQDVLVHVVIPRPLPALYRLQYRLRVD